MLRLLGLVFLLVICVGMAPLGLLVGAILCVGWLLGRPEPFPKTSRKPPTEKGSALVDARSNLSAIPLVNAVYCVNCDSITNSPHDACGVCGSHSVISVSRMWQLSIAQDRPKAARYWISFTADVREIPADGLNESTKLIGRLAELGGRIQDLHIQVDPVHATDAVPNSVRVELLKASARSADTGPHLVRQAS